MNKFIIGFVSFATGVISGYMYANKYLSNKYDKMFEDEVRDFKESFRQLRNKCKAVDKKTENKEPDYSEYFVHEDDMKDTEENDDNDKKDTIDQEENEDSSPTEPIYKNSEYKPKPYVIPPEEMGYIEEYEQISFTYYADGVLTDDFNRPLTEAEIDELVGCESLGHFGEYEEDAVYVRNERTQTDYEILMDLRNYSDVQDEYPYLKYT